MWECETVRRTVKRRIGTTDRRTNNWQIPRPLLVDTMAAVISRPERRRHEGRCFGRRKGRRTTIPISLMFKVDVFQRYVILLNTLWFRVTQLDN